MCLLFYSAGFDCRCSISPDVSHTHKLTSILLWWTNHKCLKIALAKCQCYHSHGIHQKTNVYMSATVCKTHFKRWIWSVILLSPPSSSSGLHMVLNWKTVSSGLLHLVPDQHKLCCKCWWYEHLSSLSSLKTELCQLSRAGFAQCPALWEERGSDGRLCCRFFSCWDLTQVRHPQLQVGSPGPPSGSVAFSAAKGEQLSQSHCTWLKNQLSCPWFVLLIVHSSLMKFCDSLLECR